MQCGKGARAIATAVLAVAVALVAGCQPEVEDAVLTSGVGSVGRLEPDTQWHWSPESTCAACHVGEDASLASVPCAQEQFSADACLTCHNDASVLEEAHADVSALSTRKTAHAATIADETCERCHNATELAEATAHSTVLTDANGTVANPHNLPADESHAAIACANCHNPHEDFHSASNTTSNAADITNAADVATSPANRAPQICESCHHAGVFECYTCHE